MLNASRPNAVYRLQTAAVLLLLTGALTALFWVQNLLLICVLGFVLSYFLAPFCNALERRGYSRSKAVIIVFVAFTIVALSTIAMSLEPISQQVRIFRDQWPQTQSSLISLTERIESFVRSASGAPQFEISPYLSTKLQLWTHSITSHLSESLANLATVLLLTPLISFFMLLDGRKIVRSMLAMVPQPFFESSLNLSHQINHQLGGFVRARLIESLIVSLVVLVGLSLLQMPYVVFLAVFAGVANLIPYLGPFIGVLPAFVALLSLPPGSHALSHDLMMIGVAGVFALAQIIDVFFIIPLVVARIVNLHPLLVVLSLIVGAQAMGILGMIIAIPAASICKLIMQTVYQHMLQYRT